MKSKYLAILFLCLPLGFAFVMTSQTLPYFGFNLRHGFLGTKSFKTVNTAFFQYSFYLHIGSSLLVWILGIFQLIPYFLKNTKLHRLLGKGYVLLVLCLAAPSGLGLSIFANGGLSAKIGFFLQSCVWWLLTFKAFDFIKKGNLSQHTRWTLRSLAVTYAAFSLRTESYVMINFFGTKPFETYLSVVWLSWVGNLMLIEILLWCNLDKFYLNFVKKEMTKKGVIIVALFVAGFWACKKSTSNKVVLQTHKEAVDTLRIENAVDTVVKYTYLNNSTLLDTIDLSNLLVNSEDYGDYANNFNGFFGTDNYRIEVYWEKATKDPQQHNAYFIKGKTKFKGNIANFEGKLIIDSLLEFSDPRIDLAEFGYEEAEKQTLKTYEVKGKLTMIEDKTLAHAGVFEGSFLMDFSLRNSNIAELWYFSPTTPVRGGGFVSQGFWKLNGSTTTKPYVFGKDFFMFANSILKDFSYGERDIEINEKYLHLGWDEWWESDEWWVEEKS